MDLTFQVPMQYCSLQHQILLLSPVTSTTDRTWSTGEGNGKPIQYSCLGNPMNSMKRQYDRIPKEELTRSLGAQYATGDQRRNNYRKNEGMEPKQKQYPVVDVTGDRGKIWCCKEQYCIGLGMQNEAGQRLTEFYKENVLAVANTLFQQHKRRLYTWTSPDGQHRSQTDYILCSQRRRSSIQLTKTRPGADCGSDHELLITKFRLKLKKVGKTARPFKYDLNKIPYDYTVEVEIDLRA